MNVVIILACGVGNRFGDSVPKQYHLIHGRPVIDYPIQAALLSERTDETVVVTREEYVDYIRHNYGLPTVIGGDERNISFRNALEYIKKNYQCEKIVVIDAVSPMVTHNIIDKYFDFLDEYDAVLTASKIPYSLGCYDIQQVDRARYYMVQNPHGYRFNLVYDNFDQNSNLTVISQQLPKDSKIKLYWDFTDNVKIIYKHDIKIAEALLDYREEKKTFKSHTDDIALNIFRKYRILWKKQIKEWERNIDIDVEYVFSKCGITEYVLNPASSQGLVFDVKSEKYGDAIVKFIPSFITIGYNRVIETLDNIKYASMVKGLEYDKECCSFVMKKIKPGNHVSASEDSDKISELFDALSKEKTPVSGIEPLIPNVPEYFDELTFKYERASTLNYKPDKCTKYYDVCKKLYSELSKESYLIHGDISYRNALFDGEGIKLIDPLGYRAPFEMEYARIVSYEILRYEGDYNDIINRYVKIFKDKISFETLKKVVIIDIVSMFYGAIIWTIDDHKRASEWDSILDTILSKLN